MVKHFLYHTLFLLLATGVFAQSDSIKAPYLRFPTIPLFTLLKPDSTKITRDDLSKNKKTMIMYFSPDCDHCKHQTDSMLASIKQFQDVQILMATYQPLEEMRTFYKEYKISSYSNIKMGRDTQFFFPPFYKILNLPFMVLYNEKGKLITTFEGTTPIAKLVQAFRNNG
jgi:cytochrome oxidase Cu insertion factor (SCO1/SenC/PrrC family)